MSFSADTKKEITTAELEKKCCCLAEIAGFIRVCGSIALSGNGKMDLKITTENPAAARHFAKGIKSYFGVSTKLSTFQNVRLKKGYTYELVIKAEKNSEMILRETGILVVKEGWNSISEGIPEWLLKKKCCRKAYLRGVFLGAGTVSDPEKSYHLELVSASELLAHDLKRLINSFGLKSKVVIRKKNYIVYLKEAEQVADFLNILGAHSKLLDFENIRIVKEMRNRTNRIVNCENANMDKTIDAAARQIANIRFIEETKGLAFLSEKLEKVARIRLENPEASLVELGEMLTPPLKKSGINHRLKKLDEIADGLRG